MSPIIHPNGQKLQIGAVLALRNALKGRLRVCDTKREKLYVTFETRKNNFIFVFVSRRSGSMSQILPAAEQECEHQSYDKDGY